MIKIMKVQSSTPEITVLLFTKSTQKITMKRYFLVYFNRLRFNITSQRLQGHRSPKFWSKFKGIKNVGFLENFEKMQKVAFFNLGKTGIMAKTYRYW